DKLTDDGIFSAWIPLFNLESDLLKSLLNTLHQAFPYISVWYSTDFNNKHAIMTGSKKPLKLDFNLFLEEINQPLVKQSLAMAGLDNPLQLFYSYVGNETTIGPKVKDYPVNTDDNLMLAYFIPKQEIKVKKMWLKTLIF
ncbi:MAG: hypothetical protein HC906_17960, partial [Bacteroidales bacterium]|nr:hypothetical protein [Bacteroidales bacterium]